MSPAEGLVLAAVLWAGLQLAAASWRDLGPLTIGLVGIAVMRAEQEAFAGEGPSPRLLGGLVLAVALAALAWGRGSRFGVGRVALDGLALLAATVAAVMPWLLPATIRGVPIPLVGAIAAPCALVAVIATIIALERPGTRYLRPRWYRKVPVEVAA